MHPGSLYSLLGELAKGHSRVYLDSADHGLFALSAGRGPPRSVLVLVVGRVSCAEAYCVQWSLHSAAVQSRPLGVEAYGIGCHSPSIGCRAGIERCAVEA
nr:hypothetical protein CFP56_11909 [Quercus suber]